MTKEEKVLPFTFFCAVLFTFFFQVANVQTEQNISQIQSSRQATAVVG
jgi:hypothetical protein